MSYVITENLITSRVRPRIVFKPVGIALHETATPEATAENERTYFQNGAGGRSASANAFVDYDSIVKTIPFNEQSWHAGHTANSKFISVELCNFSDRAKFDEVYKRAVWLFAVTFINDLHITKITKDNLMSHDEISKKWGETDHTDPVGYFAKFGKTVDGFRADVQALINSMIAPAPAKPKVPYCGYLLSIKLAKKKDANVAKVQAKIGTKADGYFGTNTDKAVEAFQKAHGLKVDGVVGLNTWNKLFN